MIKTINKFVIVFLVFTVSLVAKDYPIAQEQEIEIPLKKLTVIELPFKIEGDIRYGIFKTKDYKKSLVEEATPTINPAIPTRDPKAKQANNNVQKGPFPTISKGVNTLEMLPKYKGEFDMTIWGFQAYPIVIKIKIVDNKPDIDRYFVFKDYSKVLEEPLKDLPHELAIAKMIQPMYKKATREEEICLKGHVLTYPMIQLDTSNNLLLEALYECSGKRYAASKWVVTNKSGEHKRIDRDEDFKELYRNISAFFKKHGRGIYALNYDTKRRFLKKDGKVDLIVVSNILEKPIYRNNVRPTGILSREEIIKAKLDNGQSLESDNMSKSNSGDELEIRTKQDLDKKADTNRNNKQVIVVDDPYSDPYTDPYDN